MTSERSASDPVVLRLAARRRQWSYWTAAVTQLTVRRYVWLPNAVGCHIERSKFSDRAQVAYTGCAGRMLSTVPGHSPRGVVHNCHLSTVPARFIRFWRSGWLIQYFNWAAGCTICGSIPGRSKRFLSSPSVLTRSGIHPPNYSIDIDYLRVKQTEPESDHYPPAHDEVKNEWSYSSTAHYTPSLCAYQ